MEPAICYKHKSLHKLTSNIEDMQISQRDILIGIYGRLLAANTFNYNHYIYIPSQSSLLLSFELDMK